MVEWKGLYAKKKIAQGMNAAHVEVEMETLIVFWISAVKTQRLFAKKMHRNSCGRCACSMSLMAANSSAKQTAAISLSTLYFSCLQL